MFSNSGEPLDCPAATYQNATGMAECIECPPGYFCDVGFEDPLPCFRGHYCPGNSTWATMVPCPRGTFNALFGKVLILLLLMSLGGLLS